MSPDTPTACSLIPEIFDRTSDAESPDGVVLAGKCRVCPQLQPCGEYALTHDVGGFAAGMTEQHRRRLRRGAAA